MAFGPRVKNSLGTYLVPKLYPLSPLTLLAHFGAALQPAVLSCELRSIGPR